MIIIYVITECKVVENNRREYIIRGNESHVYKYMCVILIVIEGNNE